MKKRMFLSTILMTLVLLVAVTTATFAWYQVTSESKTSVVSATIETADDEYSIGDVTVKFTLKDAAGNIGPVNTDGKIFLEDENDNLIALPDNAYDKYGSVIWEVTVVFDAEKMTKEEAYKQIAGEYTVTVSGTDLRWSDVSGDKAVSEGANSIDVTFTLTAAGLEQPTDTLYFALSHLVEEKATITITGQFAE